MSSILVGGCNPIVSGRDSRTFTQKMAKLPHWADCISIAFGRLCEIKSHPAGSRSNAARAKIRWSSSRILAISLPRGSKRYVLNITPRRARGPTPPGPKYSPPSFVVHEVDILMCYVPVARPGDPPRVNDSQDKPSLRSSVLGSWVDDKDSSLRAMSEIVEPGSVSFERWPVRRTESGTREVRFSHSHRWVFWCWCSRNYLIAPQVPGEERSGLPFEMTVRLTFSSVDLLVRDSEG